MIKNIFFMILVLALTVAASIFEVWIKNNDKDKIKPYF